MAEPTLPPTSADILDFLRARFAHVDERFDRLSRQVDQVITRLIRLEREASATRRDIAEDWVGLAHRLDNFDHHLDRIEHRLGLVDTPRAEV